MVITSKKGPKNSFSYISPERVLYYCVIGKGLEQITFDVRVQFLNPSFLFFFIKFGPNLTLKTTKLDLYDYQTLQKKTKLDS